MILFSALNILVTEILFAVAELLIRTRNKPLGFVVTFTLGLYVMIMCFGGSVTSLLVAMAKGDGKPDIMSILLFFLNLFYGYMRGLGRIKAINRRYGNV